MVWLSLTLIPVFLLLTPPSCVFLLVPCYFSLCVCNSSTHRAPAVHLLHSSALRSLPDLSACQRGTNITTEFKIYKSAYLRCSPESSVIMCLPACSARPASCQQPSSLRLPRSTYFLARLSTPPSQKLLNKTAFELL